MYWCQGPGQFGVTHSVRWRWLLHCEMTRPEGPARPVDGSRNPKPPIVLADGYRLPRGLLPPSMTNHTSPDHSAAGRNAPERLTPKVPGCHDQTHVQQWMPINQASRYPIKRGRYSHAATPHSTRVWLPPRSSVRLCTTRPARSINPRNTAESYIWLLPLATQLKYSEVC